MALKPAVSKVLNQYLDPHLGQSYVALGWAREVAGALRVRLGYPVSGAELASIQAQLQRLLRENGLETPIEVVVKIARHQAQEGIKPQFGIKNVIAVGSGKGGVGKSTLAANLALALRQLGASVGLLDADIYGPSQPNIFNLQGKPEVQDKKFIPMQALGLHLMSMGSLVEDSQAMIWRGPMVSGALLQLFGETHWPDLDYLILDLPPGTGDVQLTMAQKLPVSGAVVVTTPQDLSLLDAKKAINMFKKVNIPVLGLLENMSTFVCPNCEHEEHLFGDKGGERLSLETGVPLLGQIPLARKIGQDTELGMPTMAASPESGHALAFLKAAQSIAANLATRPCEYQLNVQTVQ